MSVFRTPIELLELNQWSRLISFFRRKRDKRTRKKKGPIMLPEYSPELQTKKKPPPKSFNFSDFLYAHISSHPWFWIFIGFVLIPFLIISVAQFSPPYSTNHTSAAAECPSGRVYAYDLPPMFNDDLLLHNCTDLDPWNWQCGIATDHGLGGAAAELRRVLPEKLSKSWRRTNQFALELIFHRRILQHECRTLEPESAAAFYIPFYAGLAVGKYLWINDTAKRDHHSEMMLRWVLQQNYWSKSNGSDHFTTIGRITWDFRRLTDPGRDWGSSYLNKPEMRRVTRFIIERNPDDDRDVGVPYPTGFHPETRETLEQWQSFVRDYNRSSLFTFIGAARGSDTTDFRGLLLSYCTNESTSCRAVDCAVARCSVDSSAILESLLGSEFCLQPVGDSFTRRSVFDCMVAGSVPVFFWTKTAYEQYEWFLPGEPGSYSVFIDHEEVKNRSSIIKEVLMGYRKEEIRKMREKVIESIPRIIYGTRNEKSTDLFKDAFDIALDGVLERIKKERELSHIS